MEPILTFFKSLSKVNCLVGRLLKVNNAHKTPICLILMNRQSSYKADK